MGDAGCSFGRMTRTLLVALVVVLLTGVVWCAKMSWAATESAQRANVAVHEDREQVIRLDERLKAIDRSLVEIKSELKRLRPR